MASEQELTLIAKAKDFDKAAGEVRKVTDEERKLAEAVLKSGNASKEGAAAARAHIEQYQAQQEAARKAVPATEALRQAQEKLNKAQENLGRARTSGSVGEVEQYQEEVSKARQEVEKFGGAQDQANASEEEYISLLQQTHPALGAFADAGVKASRVLGQIGEGNINVRETLAVASKALKNNIGLLKTLAASGFVVAGITAIVTAFRSMRAEMERNIKTMGKQRDRMTELGEAAEQQAQRIARAAAGQRGGNLTLAEQRDLQRRVESIGQRFPGLDQSNVEEVGVAAGTDATDEQIVRGAVLRRLGLIEPNRDQKPEDFVQAIDRVFERNREAAARESQSVSRGGQFDTALREGAPGLTSPTGDIAGIKRAIQLTDPQASETQAKRLAQLVQAFSVGEGADGAGTITGGIGAVFSGLATGITGGVDAGNTRARRLSLLDAARSQGVAVPEDVSDLELQRAEQLRRSFRRRLSPEGEDAPEPERERPPRQTVVRHYQIRDGQPVVVQQTYNMQNSRNVVPGRRSEHEVRNGQSRAAEVQRGVVDR